MIERKKIISYVIECFADMGATKEQLQVEADLLSSDDGYLDLWASVTGFSDQDQKVG